MTQQTFLQVAGMTKAFPGVQALDDVDFEVRAGEVHGLVGPNGAGKSTLIKILAGVERQDAGTIRVAGEQVELHSAEDAWRHGLVFIHQEPQLVHRLSVLENITLGVPRARRAGVLLDWPAIRKQAQAVADRVGLDAPLDAEVATLGAAQQGLIAIARALLLDARLLVLDEPTAMLTDVEIQRLYGVITDLVADGVAVVYVSHRLEEIFQVTQRVTVMRNGCVVTTRRTADLNGEDELVALIAGQAVAAVDVAPSARTRPVLLRVRDLCGPPRVSNVTFDLHEGEVLGLTGLVGAGRSELAMLLFGAERPTGGTMELSGETFAPRSPADAIGRGLAFLAEDRRADGGVMTMSVRQNITLSNLKALRASRLFPFINGRRERQTTNDLIRRLSVKVANPDGTLAVLSGGNQQKVLIGRALNADAKLMIFDEPTHGVDVRSRAEIYRLIGELAEQGKAVLVISSDLKEVIDLCPRVLVMREGQLVADVETPDESKLLTHAYGHRPRHVQAALVQEA